jgi:hypothetical protein
VIGSGLTMLTGLGLVALSILLVQPDLLRGLIALADKATLKIAGLPRRSEARDWDFDGTTAPRQIRAATAVNFAV